MTRVAPEHRQKFALAMQDDYDAGLPIRSLAVREGMAYSTMHAHLTRVGTKLRPRGGRKRVKQPAA